MVWRTSSSAKMLHLLHEEWQQCAFILDCGLGHWVEIGLVGRTTALCHHHKTVFIAFHCLNVYLCRQVASCVHLVIHVQRSILRIAQVVLGVSVIHTERESFLILKVSPHTLSLLTMYNSSTCILTERQYALACCLGIAQELQCHILVVLRCFGVGKNLSHLLVMFTAQHELHVVESLLGKQCQCFL